MKNDLCWVDGMRVLLAVSMVGCVACGRVDEHDASQPDARVDASTPSSDAGCLGATVGTYRCGGEVRACDPTAPPGLPSGACSEGASCFVTVRPANCACPEDDGPRYPWSCTCVGGAWTCTPGPPDARICGCLLNPPHAASCEPPRVPTGTSEHRWVGLEPVDGTRSVGFAARVTLQGSTSPDLATKAAVVGSIRIYSETSKAWVRPEIGPIVEEGSFVSWTVRPKDRPLAGDWVLRVGPLPTSPGLGFADGPFVYCEGVMETHFTVLE